MWPPGVVVPGHGYGDTLHEGGVLVVCTLQLAVRHRGVRRDGERDDLHYILLPQIEIEMVGAKNRVKLESVISVGVGLQLVGCGHVHFHLWAADYRK